MTIISKRTLVTLALAASVSVGASAFNPGAFVKNAVGKSISGNRKIAFPAK